MLKFIITFLFVFIANAASAEEEFYFGKYQVLNPNEIASFGYDYMDKKIATFATLTKIAPCRHPKNKKYYCGIIEEMNQTYYFVMFPMKANFSGKILKSHMHKCGTFFGTIKDMPTSYFGNEGTEPSLIVDQIYSDKDGKRWDTCIGSWINPYD